MRMSSQLLLETGGEWSKDFLFQLGHKDELHQGHVSNHRERLPTKDFLVRQKATHFNIQIQMAILCHVSFVLVSCSLFFVQTVASSNISSKVAVVS